MQSRTVTAMVSATVMLSAAGVALGQDYPHRPVRIVTSTVGGGNDFMARYIAQGITGPLGQPIIVDNRPSGVIPGQVVSRSSPDGYTALVTASAFWTSQLFRADVPYDVEKDFVPVSILDRASLLLIVSPKLPVNSVKELLAYARTSPGALNYASGSTGSSSHLAAELFKNMTGLNIVRVAYGSNAQEVAEMAAGQVHLAITATPATVQLAKSGKLRALAHTGEQSSPLYPGFPTVASAVPGYRTESFTTMFMPAKTPAAAVRRLNQEVVRFLRTQEAKDRLLINGAEAIGSSPEELAQLLKTEIAQWGKVIKAAGIKPD